MYIRAYELNLHQQRQINTIHQANSQIIVQLNLL